MSDQSAPHETVAQHLKKLYVRILLRLLPLLISVFRHISPKIRAEIDYLASGYTFMLRVEGTNLACACRRMPSGSFKRVAPQDIASDTEPGSGLKSAQPQAISIDYVISFRSNAYAFACFSGGMTLKDALAQRAFSTRGPNNTGVALTYLFTALLRMFFGWRKVYRSTPHLPTTRTL